MEGRKGEAREHVARGMRVTSHALKSGDKSPHSIAGFARDGHTVVVADRRLQAWKRLIAPPLQQEASTICNLYSTHILFFTTPNPLLFLLS